MELVKKLGTKRIWGKSRWYGIFYCPECKDECERLGQDGMRQKNCGCINRSRRHHAVNSRLNVIWHGMKQRCNNKTSKDYIRYGGRGVLLWPEWNEFVPFYNWAVKNGYKDSLQIDRIDNEGNYEPSNCRWVTPKQNSRNKRNKKLTEQKAHDIRKLYKERGMKQKELSEIYGVSQTMISKIVRNTRWVN